MKINIFDGPLRVTIEDTFRREAAKHISEEVQRVIASRLSAPRKQMHCHLDEGVRPIHGKYYYPEDDIFEGGRLVQVRGRFTVGFNLDEAMGEVRLVTFSRNLRPRAGGDPLSNHPIRLPNLLRSDKESRQDLGPEGRVGGLFDMLSS